MVNRKLTRQNRMRVDVPFRPHLVTRQLCKSAEERETRNRQFATRKLWPFYDNGGK